VAAGAQFRVCDALTVRAGYSFNQNPIPDNLASENIGAGAVEQHTLYVGGSYRLSEALLVSAAYVHVFRNGIEGPLVTPHLGPIPGTFVRDEILGVDSFLAGITVQF
jgi:long-chain fatty acid transport protein